MSNIPKRLLKRAGSGPAFRLILANPLKRPGEKDTDDFFHSIEVYDLAGIDECLAQARELVRALEAYKEEEGS